MWLFSPREHMSSSSAFRRMLASVHFAATMHPQCALLLSLHWSELLSKLLPDSQSSVTSRKCGFRGRTRWFRVPFGTGPGMWYCWHVCLWMLNLATSVFVFWHLVFIIIIFFLSFFLGISVHVFLLPYGHKYCGISRKRWWHQMCSTNYVNISIHTLNVKCNFDIETINAYRMYIQNTPWQSYKSPLYRTILLQSAEVRWINTGYW